jgi:hypothetical protein
MATLKTTLIPDPCPPLGRVGGVTAKHVKIDGETLQNAAEPLPQSTFEGAGSNGGDTDARMAKIEEVLGHAAIHLLAKCELVAEWVRHAEAQEVLDNLSRNVKAVAQKAGYRVQHASFHCPEKPSMLGVSLLPGPLISPPYGPRRSRRPAPPSWTTCKLRFSRLPTRTRRISSSPRCRRLRPAGRGRGIARSPRPTAAKAPQVSPRWSG